MKYEPKVVIGSLQKHAYIGRVSSYSPCVNAACGMGGGQTPIVIYVYQEDIEQ